jgi:hypothetical protein
VKFGVACCLAPTGTPDLYPFGQWGWGLAHLLQCSNLQSAFAMAARLELPGADGAASWLATKGSGNHGHVQLECCIPTTVVWRVTA